MPDCILLKDCLFFNEKMRGMPTTTDIYKQNYCRGDNNTCARYRVYLSLGRDKVPPDLFPNQVERVLRYIDRE
jgi:hypothetical protein